MVYFVTGSIGSGKSTRLLELYKSINSGDGFYNIRRYSNGKTIGQDIVRLSTGESIFFSRIDGVIPSNWDEEARFMNYSFSKEGLKFACNIIDEIIRNNLQAAFIDELGPLEINKEGLYNHFSKLLRKDTDIYVVCRDTCINGISDTFSITNHIMI